MFKKAEEVNHLKFRLENRSVTRGERIATGYYPLAEDAALTVLFDMTITDYQGSGYGRTYKLISAYNNVLNVSGIRVGKYRAADSTTSVWFNSSSTYYVIPQSWANNYRHKIAVTHEAGSDTLYVEYRREGKTAHSLTVTNTFTADTAGQLFFGGGENNDNSLPTGVINLAEVYDVVLPAEDITSFLTF